MNVDKYIHVCKKRKQKLPCEQEVDPFEHCIKKIITEQPEFFTRTKHKYLDLFPESKESLDKLEENLCTLEILLKDPESSSWNVIRRIVDEFAITHPKLHAAYSKWTSYHRRNLPTQDILDIMKITKADELFHYLIHKVGIGVSQK
jgi:hypothetical protein